MEVAKAIIKMAPKSADATQARSIILEMTDAKENAPQLLLLEKQSRLKGHSTVANNLTLSRVVSHEDPNSIKALRTVYESATAANDTYNAYRAVTKLARFSYLQTGTIEQEDLKRLMAAYHYFYGERFGALFTSAHLALWDYFEEHGEIENLLALFRHSSFVWRLNGHEDKEKKYLETLEKRKNEILLLGERIDKNVLYFLGRAAYQVSRLEGSPKSG